MRTGIPNSGYESGYFFADAAKRYPSGKKQARFLLTAQKSFYAIAEPGSGTGRASRHQRNRKAH